MLCDWWIFLSSGLTWSHKQYVGSSGSISNALGSMSSESSLSLFKSLSCFDLSFPPNFSEFFLPLLLLFPLVVEFPPFFPADGPGALFSVPELFGVLVPPRLFPSDLTLPGRFVGVDSRTSSFVNSERSALGLSSLCCFFLGFLATIVYSVTDILRTVR